MVSHGLKRAGDALKQPVVLVEHLTCFSVHGYTGLDEGSSEIFTNCLMAEAYSQNWNGLMEHVNHLHHTTGVGGPFGSWRQNDTLDIEFREVGRLKRVIAHNGAFHPRLQQVIVQVERKRVVVVEQKYVHHTPIRHQCGRIWHWLR